MSKKDNIKRAKARLARINRVEKMFHAGYSVLEMAEKEIVHTGTIQADLRALELKIKTRDKTEVDRAEIRRMFMNRVKPMDISKKLNVGLSTVYITVKDISSRHDRKLADIALVVKMRRDGVNYAEISETINRSVSTCSRYFSERYLLGDR